MNLTQLKYFNAVCTYKSVSAAAEFMFVSQPTISGALKELEEEFGTLLFKRHHRGMVLTAEGSILYNMSRDLISRAEQIEHVMNDLGKNRKLLRLGIPPMIGSLFLPDIHGAFHAEHPSVALEISEGGKSELKGLLENDYLDMMFLSHNEPFDSHFTVQPITKVETVFCISKNHPLAGLKSVTPLDLTDIPLVLFKNSFFQTELIKKSFAEYDVNPRILLQTEQLSNVLRLISNNTAAGFLFRPLTNERPDLVAIPMEKRLYADISLIWKKDTYMSGAMKSFSEYMKNKKLKGL